MERFLEHLHFARFHLGMIETSNVFPIVRWWTAAFRTKNWVQWCHVLVTWLRRKSNFTVRSTEIEEKALFYKLSISIEMIDFPKIGFVLYQLVAQRSNYSFSGASNEGRETISCIIWFHRISWRRNKNIYLCASLFTWMIKKKEVFQLDSHYPPY